MSFEERDTIGFPPPPKKTDSRTDNFIEIWKGVRRLQASHNELLAAAKTVAAARSLFPFILTSEYRKAIDTLAAAIAKAEERET